MSYPGMHAPFRLVIRYILMHFPGGEMHPFSVCSTAEPLFVGSSEVFVSVQGHRASDNQS